jgi:hypothetical protein
MIKQLGLPANWSNSAPSKPKHHREQGHPVRRDRQIEGRQLRKFRKRLLAHIYALDTVEAY